MLITTFHNVIQRFFGGLFAVPHLFQFFVFHGANLHVVAQANAAALVGHFADHLRDGDICTRFFFVKARFFSQLVSRRRDGQIACTFVAGRLHLGAGHIIEESCNTFVFSGFFTRHNPQTCAADDGVLRCASHVGVVGQR